MNAGGHVSYKPMTSYSFISFGLVPIIFNRKHPLLVTIQYFFNSFFKTSERKAQQASIKNGNYLY